MRETSVNERTRVRRNYYTFDTILRFSQITSTWLSTITMAPSTRRVKRPDCPDKFVWLYGNPKMRDGCYEYHPAVQSHIEEAYLNDKDKCMINFHGVKRTLSFDFMSDSSGSDTRQIKRVHSTKLHMSKCKGISGASYVSTKGYQQTDEKCNICFHKQMVPTRIPACGHSFCYTCIKTNFKRRLPCPMCRGDLPTSLFVNPIRYDVDFDVECPEEFAEDCSAMFKKPDNEEVGESSSKREESKLRHYWIYEARGFWYRNKPSCTLFICGVKMQVDFKKHTQKGDEWNAARERKIKRIAASDMHKFKIRGIAGVSFLVQPIS
ncbi:hypothetical protein L5515_017847 [Caenorhabditis briggsae]|uniref:RING-type domain-containing protein n=2 Tax=Caenorhabditis briggsae TaxID=6238 RepID=A0AAE9FEE1_CAEBR|nr:hypothetical protein L5515_017847 [Caenorhabditis briggsae]